MASAAGKACGKISIVQQEIVQHEIVQHETVVEKIGFIK